VQPTCTPKAGPLRQVGAELGVTAATVSHQLRRAGVTMRRGGASAHPASIIDTVSDLIRGNRNDPPGMKRLLGRHASVY
jgi:hypothetical protein